MIRFSRDVSTRLMIMFEGFCALGQYCPRFKTIKVISPVFTESKVDMDSVFEFEPLVRWLPKELEAASSVVKDESTVTTTDSSLTPPDSRVSVKGLTTNTDQTSVCVAHC
jgi:hypothetical protein